MNPFVVEQIREYPGRVSSRDGSTLLSVSAIVFSFLLFDFVLFGFHASMFLILSFIYSISNKLELRQKRITMLHVETLESSTGAPSNNDR